MLRHREFDVAEMSLSSYVVSLFTPERPFIAIPVFPSRLFRHSCIYVNAGSGIREPRDLIGKGRHARIQMTAPVWIRGILADDYGVPVIASPTTPAGRRSPGRTEKLKLALPPKSASSRSSRTRRCPRCWPTAISMPCYTARMPSSFRDGTGQVTRLFEDFEHVERDYFRRTGIFPIMHTVVIRRDVLERDPGWRNRSTRRSAPHSGRPTTTCGNGGAEGDVAVAAGARGGDPARDGRRLLAVRIPGNRATLATFLRYSYEQGLSKELLEPEQLFVPQTLESFRI